MKQGLEELDAKVVREVFTAYGKANLLYERRYANTEAQESKYRGPRVPFASEILCITPEYYENKLTEHVAKDRHLKRGSTAGEQPDDRHALWLVISHYFRKTHASQPVFSRFNSALVQQTGSLLFLVS